MTGRPLRVLQVIDSLARSGAEQSLVSMVPHLVSKGIAMDVAYLYERDGLKEQLEAAGARTFSLGDPASRRAAVIGLRRSIRTLAPDLVHTTLFDADVVGRTAARLTGVPVVSSLVNVHYGPEQLADPRLRPSRVRAAQTIDAVTARACVRFHAITLHVADVMSQRLRIRRELIDVIPRGRDPELLGERTTARRMTSRAALGLEAEIPVILAVARQEHQKGLDVLLDAFPAVLAAVPEARLIVAGREGQVTPALRSAVRRLRLERQVRFLGQRSDVPDLLCAADVFVLPSRWEGLGGTLLEAMALQTPIVASDIAPVREIVTDDGSATLVRPEDALALSDALIATLKDPDRATGLATTARARFVESFTVDRVSERMVGFYERALAAGR
jgi:glycosyltransferase involved in cell wall biosynthesis